VDICGKNGLNMWGIVESQEAVSRECRTLVLTYSLGLSYLDREDSVDEIERGVGNLGEAKFFRVYWKPENEL